jgi:hypothetical protein
MASDRFGITVIDGIAGSNDSWMGYDYWKSEADKYKGIEPLGTVLCERIGTKNCELSGNRIFRADIAAPVCKTGESNCIQGISAKNNETEIQGTFVKYLQGNRVRQDSRFSLPRGESASLWNLPGFPNASGQENYLVTSHITMKAENSRAFKPLDFNASIIPVKINAMPGAEPSIKYNAKDPKTGENQVYGNAPAEGCYLSDTNVCYEEVGFGEGRDFSLSFRYDNQIIGGWFSAYLDKPSMSVSTRGSTSLLKVSGSPVEIPRFQFASEGAASKDVKSVYKKYNRELGELGIQSVDTEAADFLDVFRVAARDSATGERQAWSFRSAGQGPYNRCLSNKSTLLGMVSTNALIYQGTPPELKSGFLSYTVAGMHFKSDQKTLALGRYNLVMRESVAQCLFGLGKVPVNATVSITGGQEQNVATTVVSRKAGWIKLNAEGFTYSKKTIKVKITKKKK